ncbi:MAG: FAD-binding oxidoreductase [Gemmobacter sp.]|uniref:FAD-binding oxidoreductase n=1 Tax=Gemmobacter sp. TaxID=1898957 RepID=UPI00391E03DF
MTRSELFAALSARLGARFQTGAAIRDQHGRDESHLPAAPPEAVAWPLDTAEVAAIVAACAAARCPVVAWGAGTSLEGHALAVQGGIVLDMTRMDRVLAVRPEDMDCTVQPGITREALNAALRATGLFFPVDPGANATLGGMAGTRASGTTAVRYGTMRDNVLGLEVVLADGRIVRTGGRARKSSTGYDLTRLMVGSEGTLGIITELTLRLHGQPEAVVAAVCGFPEIGAAVDAVIETMQAGVPMARIEFVDEAAIAAFNAYAGAAMPLRPHLFLEFHGSAAGVAEQAETVGAIMAGHGAGAFRWATATEDRARLWKMRHNAYYAAKALRPGCRVLTTDVCVPISALAQAVRETRADIDASPLPGPMLGHVGDGNFHVTLLIDPDSAAERDEALRLAHRMAERALALGGTVSGEHGVGLGKRKFMAAEHGEGWQVMGAIKAALDPLNILNPGKIVP